MKTSFFFIDQKTIIRNLFIFAIFAIFISVFCIAHAADTATNDAVSSEQPTEKVYTEKQLQDLISPSVVRIVQHVEGSAQIPAFVIDIEDRTISLDNTGESIVFDDINEYIIGNGFIINPDGHILTNAHLVSDITSKLAIISPYIEKAVLEFGDTVSESVEEDMTFSLKILDFVIENSTFELTKEIVVIDPDTYEEQVSGGNIFDINQIGFTASVLYVNNNFYKEGSNLAIIKFAGKNLPAVSVLDENIIAEGDKFYAFNTSDADGFKNISDFKNSGIYDLEMKESFITEEMDENDTGILYTDIRLYRQATGGPVFNTAGEIVGILAFEGQDSRSADQPIRMLIIPNNIIQVILDRAGVDSVYGVYATHFQKGIEYINDGRCDNASYEFEDAIVGGQSFVNRTDLNFYLTECYKTEAYKDSESSQGGISGLLNMIQEKSASLDILDWVIIILLSVLGLTLIIILFVIIGKLRKKKEEPYKPSKEDRSEEMQKARRTSLSEALPKQIKEVPARSVGSDVVVLSADKVPPRLEPKKNISKKEINLEIKIDNKTTLETLQTIPKEDQKQLAELWPKKYDTNKSENSIGAKKTERLTKNDNPSVSKTTEKETVVASSNVDPMLAKYIQETHALGFNDEDIGRELERAGWKSEDINTAFNETK